MIYGKINTEFKDDIQLVSAYRAIDGELFSTEKEAREHSYSIKVLSDTKKVVSSMLTVNNFNRLTTNGMIGRSNAIDFLTDLIIRDRESIIEALQGGLEYESYEDK